MDYSPWDGKELDMTAWLSTQHTFSYTDFYEYGITHYVLILSSGFFHSNYFEIHPCCSMRKLFTLIYYLVLSYYID